MHRRPVDVMAHIRWLSHSHRWIVRILTCLARAVGVTAREQHHHRVRVGGEVQPGPETLESLADAWGVCRRSDGESAEECSGEVKMTTNHRREHGFCFFSGLSLSNQQAAVMHVGGICFQKEAPGMMDERPERGQREGVSRVGGRPTRLPRWESKARQAKARQTVGPVERPIRERQAGRKAFSATRKDSSSPGPEKKS